MEAERIIEELEAEAGTSALDQRVGAANRLARILSLAQALGDEVGVDVNVAMHRVPRDLFDRLAPEAEAIHFPETDDRIEDFWTKEVPSITNNRFDTVKLFTDEPPLKGGDEDVTDSEAAA